MSGARVALRFGAVFYEAHVWLNDVSVGRHEGGYTPFELDVTKAARPGRSNGGIVRNVAVELTSRVYVAHERVVATPVLSGEGRASSAAVEMFLRVRNATARRFEGVATAAVDDVSASTALSVEAGKSRTVRLRLTLDGPRLWHFDHPELYTLTSSVKDGGGEVLDRVMTSFGVRTVEFRDARLLLNGEPVRLVGLTRHADSPAHGLAEPAEVVEADYDDLKRLNQVLTRPVHYPQSEAVLDYADRHGILLIPEVPAWQLHTGQLADPRVQAVERAQLREMVASEVNHPSVIAWSIANEIESDTPEGYEFVRKAIAAVKAADSTRPVGFASNRLNGSPASDATRFADFVLMNQYFGTWAGPKQGLGAALDRIHEAFPAKPVIVSEFGFEPRWQELVGQTTSSLDPASYHTRTNFVMGVVDALRRRRGSWERVRAEYAPARVSSFSFVPGGARIVVSTRADLPSYTLRGFALRWSTGTEDGALALPPLPPGSTWSGELTWRGSPRRVELAVVRPTGYAVLEQTFHR